MNVIYGDSVVVHIKDEKSVLFDSREKYEYVMISVGLAGQLGDCPGWQKL